MLKTETPIVIEIELRRQQQLLTCIKSLSVEERAAFDKWYAEHQVGVPTSDWPGFKKYFPDGLR
jgi:hypothetical protein